MNDPLVVAPEAAEALAVELDEIDARSKENAREQGWGIPDYDSPWTAAAKMIRALRAELDAVKAQTEPGAETVRAAAVRETARYIERITRRGMVPLSRVLADMEAAAERMEKGMTARGSTRFAVLPKKGQDQ